MILKITIALTILVAVNFLLLFISCNKNTKRVKSNKKPIILKKQLSNQVPVKLAPTGS